jgi:hypothetical protein
MDRTNSLFAGLAGLTKNLDKPEVDLELEMRRLGDDLARAVSSYLGLTLTITSGAGPISLSTWQEHAGAAAIGSSLLIPLPLICPTPPGSTLLLHAAVPGAFVDLTADLSHAIGQPLDAFDLDCHRTDLLTPIARPELTGLAEFCHLNQAIGVLLERGHSREQAYAELWHRARDVGGDMHAAAKLIIASTQRGLAPIPSGPRQHDRSRA